MKGVLIGGPRSGAGKTTITLGVLAGLAERGLRVQPFKVGPDYIDIGFHAALTRRPCYNLDGWLMPGERLLSTYWRAAAATPAAARVVPPAGPPPDPPATLPGADIAVVEGMMGLFDGIGSGDDGGSSADIARRLGLPVVLVLDVRAMSGSAGAAALGYREYDERLDLRGVILNNVVGEHHAATCQRALARVGLPVLGVVPAGAALRLPERHLGLVPAWERSGPAHDLEELALEVASHLDIEALLEIAGAAATVRSAPPRPAIAAGAPAGAAPGAPAGAAPGAAPGAPAGAAAVQRPPPGPRVRIGIARDEAFGFYYQDTLDVLAAAGAELVTFRPTGDAALPEGVAGLVLGGGFPERHLEALEANTTLRDAVRERAAAGMPILAECGGLMYLCRSISAGGAPGAGRRAMAGVLDGHVCMGARQAVAYVEVEVERDTPLVAAGERLRGHVFHNSIIEGVGEEAVFAYRLEPGPGIVERRDGWLQHNVLASYTHLPLAAHPELVERWLAACRSGRSALA